MQIGSSALLQYRLIEKNLDREMARFEKQQPQLKRDLAYLREKAPKIDSVDALLKDRRALQITLSAFQLEDQINSKAIIKKLLTEDPDDKKSLAFRMLDPRFRQLALSMKDLAAGKRPFDSKAFVETIAEAYQTNEFEKAKGEETPGLREALFFKRTIDGVDITTKLGKINRTETDLTTRIGGVSFSLDRRYESMEPAQDKPSFGSGWTFLGLEPRIETSVPATGREKDGIYNAFAVGSRVNLTLPTGERAAFTFKPTVERVNGVEYYRPAFVAEGTHGWKLSSPDVKLTKRGDKFYEAESGRPYNPANAKLSGADYTLTRPDDFATMLDPTQPKYYLLDTKLGTTDIATKGGARLTISANEIKASSGETLKIIRDNSGRVTRIDAPTGKSVSYEYDKSGTLVGAKNAQDKTGANYAYREGVLVSAETLGTKGKKTTYAPPIEKVSQVLANRVLAEVARVAVGLPDQVAALEYDQQKDRMEKKLNLKDFQDPKKVDKFVERFLVNNDIKNGGTTDPVLSLFSGGGLNLLA